MGIVFEQRPSDSPLVETITHGYTTEKGSSIRPAETNWHMVFVKHPSGIQSLVVGPLTTAGLVSYEADAEILWVRFRLGAFMPRLLAKNFLNVEAPMPTGAGQSFCLDGSTWQLPNFDNVDTFINRLARTEILTYDPVVDSVLQGHRPELAARTVRHRFLHATGLTQNQIHQIGRAQRAATLLRQGNSILDTIEEAGYYDQPHLTRALKQWVGHSPAELVRANSSN